MYEITTPGHSSSTTAAYNNFLLQLENINEPAMIASEQRSLQNIPNSSTATPNNDPSTHQTTTSTLSTHLPTIKSTTTCDNCIESVKTSAEYSDFSEFTEFNEFNEFSVTATSSSDYNTASLASIIPTTLLVSSTTTVGNLTGPQWPVKLSAVVEGDIVLGGLMMVHEREDSITCGPVMPQGGVQALEAMLYTLDRVNEDLLFLPNITIGAHILDDCDKDTYGLEMAVDFIKGLYSNL